MMGMLNGKEAAERVVIPIIGQGMIDDDEAAVILENPTYKAALENPDVLVELHVGNAITNTAPSFWHQLLTHAYASFLTQSDLSADRDGLAKLGVSIRNKIDIKFEPSDKADEMGRQSEIAHRFIGACTDYVQCVGYKEMALVAEDSLRELATPEKPLDSLKRLGESRRQKANALRQAITSNL